MPNLFNITSSKLPHRYEFKEGCYIEVDEDYLEIKSLNNRKRYYSMGLTPLVDKALAAVFLNGVDISVAISLTTEMKIEIGEIDECAGPGCTVTKHPGIYIHTSDGYSYEFKFIMND